MTTQSTVPFNRVGPRPLGLYFALLQSQNIPDIMQNIERFYQTEGLPHIPDAIFDALMTQAKQASADRFLSGVKRYHSYEWHRPQKSYKSVWEKGRVKLLDLGGEGEPIILIPSLINRFYIFDLMSGASIADHLIEAGYHVFAVDWGCPETSGEHKHLDDLLLNHLKPAVDYVTENYGPAVLLGYCMGGLHAQVMAHYCENIKGLVMAAVPWDFHKTPTSQAVRSTQTIYEAFLNGTKYIPIDLLQTHFTMLDPFGTIRRMEAYATEDNEDQLRRMSAIEDWLSDGIPLETTVAKVAVYEWYVENKPVKGEWKVGAKIITPSTLPTFFAIPDRDIIVPKESAMPLVEGCENPTVHYAPSGHIGIMVGRKAKDGLYSELVHWLNDL